MLEFASAPDPIFMAIVTEALDDLRTELYPWRPEARLDADAVAHVDEAYGDLYPDLAAVLTRQQALAMSDGLTTALTSPDLYQLNDYHWLLLHEALSVFADLHNDDARGTDGKIGPYLVDQIELGPILDAYFFDTDFAVGPALLQGEEHRPDFLRPSRAAWKIAAGLPPADDEIAPCRIDPSESQTEPPDASRRPFPTSGYVGPYPLLEPRDAQT